MPESDTIAAVSTPVGVGAVSIVRISGPEAIPVVDASFRGRHMLAEVPPNSVHHGKIVDGEGHLVDEVLVSVFRAPHSFTGDDLVEIGCHGGMLVTAKVLEQILASGARQAAPGEFTKRAFLNGKIDLSRAEAIGELIASRSQRAMKTSLDQLEGRLSRHLERVKSDILGLCSLLELELDFSEEGVDLVPRAEVRGTIGRLRSDVLSLISSYESGRLAREGVSVVLLGAPNVGKSSIFNALLETDRAIVSPTPGTTRDSIEESIVLGGQLFRLTDTAGLRESVDVVEAEGIDRTKKRASRADIAIVVIDSAEDSTVPYNPAEIATEAKVLFAFNKMDLVRNGGMRKSVVLGPGHHAVDVSAKTGEGMDKLREELFSLAHLCGVSEEDSPKITSLRHRELLVKAERYLSNAEVALESGQNSEIIAFELRESLNSIGEITGEVTSDDILNNIFGKFCIGK
jgi:tRNA modification GTPase